MNRSILSKLSFSFVAQLLSIAVSLVFSLGITKVLNVENYGYWQLFILYSSYAGFFHFGICDGIYLKLGGRKLSKINPFNFTNQVVYFTGLQLFISLLFIIILFNITGDPIKFKLLLLVSPFLIIANLQTFLSYTLLSTNNIEDYAKSVLIEKVFIITTLIVLYIFNFIAVDMLIYVYLSAKSLSLIYLFFRLNTILEYKALLRLKKKNLKILVLYAAIGIPLMFSNILSTLLIGSNRLLTESKYGIVAFSKLSFSISLVFLFIIFVSQLGIVLFPMLKSMGQENKKIVFNWINNTLTIIFICSLVMYFPLVEFVKIFVPAYNESVKYLTILLPICIFEGKFQVVHNTMYKVLNKQKTIFLINAISLVLSVLLTFAALYIFNSIIYSLYVLVVVIMIRSVLSELVLLHLMKIPIYKPMYEAIAVSFCFIIVNNFFSYAESFIIFACIVIFYIIFKIIKNEISFKPNTIN